MEVSSYLEKNLRFPTLLAQYKSYHEVYLYGIAYKRFVKPCNDGFVWHIAQTHGGMEYIQFGRFKDSEIADGGVYTFLKDGSVVLDEM